MRQKRRRIRVQNLSKKEILSWAPWLGTQLLRDGWVITGFIILPKTIPAAVVLGTVWILVKVIDWLMQPVQEEADS